MIKDIIPLYYTAGLQAETPTGPGRRGISGQLTFTQKNLKDANKIPNVHWCQVREERPVWVHPEA